MITQNNTFFKSHVLTINTINHRLDNLAPVPRNITEERIPPPSMLSMLSPFLSGPMYVLGGGARAAIRIGGAYFSRATNSSSSNSSSSSIRAVKDDVKESEHIVESATSLSSIVTDSGEPCAGNGTCPAPTSSDSDSEVRVLASAEIAAAVVGGAVGAVEPTDAKVQTINRITEGDWTHMQDYTDPLHLSIHTSQLSEVRYLYAALHCFALHCFEYLINCHPIFDTLIFDDVIRLDSLLTIRLCCGAFN